MPPNTRKAPRRGAERGESSSAALEDDLGDGDVEAWENAARDAARGQKAAMRKEHLDVLSTLRKWGKEMMLERGMKQWATEAVGDCWLISLLAGSEGLDAEQVVSCRNNASPASRRAREYRAKAGDCFGRQLLAPRSGLYQLLHLRQSWNCVSVPPFVTSDDLRR